MNESIESHWITLYVNDNNAAYFVSFGVENVPAEIKKFIEKKTCCHNYLQSRSIRFDNVRTFLCWIYCFYVQRYFCKSIFS